MADPERDSGFVYNEQGFVDILRSPFFDLNLEVDDSVEEYVERIIFTLSNTIEEQLSTVQWQITAKPRQGFWSLYPGLPSGGRPPLSSPSALDDSPSIRQKPTTPALCSFPPLPLKVHPPTTVEDPWSAPSANQSYT
ncbi:hypothetical protein M5K25_023534 [Dendrobium thyrsiflorum]|uniref:Uncharacterized protein n=1 Tax=Dendrobium thyrsiflorum TaxID=117978 RepID=A0ABD0UFQ7_DENTH